MFTKFNFVFLSFVFVSCQSFSPKKSDIATVVILGTNDIHGALDSKTRDPKTGLEVSQPGGLLNFSAYLRILQRSYGKNLLWLDAGDQLQGSLESNTYQGKPVIEVLNELGLKAAAIGNHEFDFGPDLLRSKRKNAQLGALLSRMEEARFPYLAANLSPQEFFPKLKTSVIFETENLKVGVVGLSTKETPQVTNAANVKKLKFLDYLEPTLQEAKALREKNADLVILVGHLGTDCEKFPGCEPSSEVYQLLEALPPGTIDAFVSGHSHTLVHHFIKGVPVIQAGSGLKNFNLIYFQYDKKKRSLLRDLTKIEGPIPVDLKNSQVYRNEKLETDPRINQVLAPYIEKTEELKNQVIGLAENALDQDRHKESALGNFIADSLRARLKTDVALLNGGGIRAPIDQGPILFGELYQSLPFDNLISKLQLSGRELRLLLRIAQSGARGLFPVSGLRLRLSAKADPKLSIDLNKNGKIEDWEQNRLLEAKLSDNSKIQDSKMYSVATVDFLANGGDNLSWFMSQIPAARKTIVAGPTLREVVVESIKRKAKNGALNTRQNPYYKKESPRFEFVN